MCGVSGQKLQCCLGIMSLMLSCLSLTFISLTDNNFYGNYSTKKSSLGYKQWHRIFAHLIPVPQSDTLQFLSYHMYSLSFMHSYIQFMNIFCIHAYSSELLCADVSNKVMYKMETSFPVKSLNALSNGQWVISSQDGGIQ